MERGFLSDWAKKYASILEYNHIEWELIGIDDLNFWNKLKTCSHFIYHWGGSSDAHQKAHAILPVIDCHLDIPVFPDWKTSWHYDDKIKGYYLLKTHDFPVIDAYIFFNKKKALDWINNLAELPLVFKLTRGAGSQNVRLIKSRREAIKLIKKMFGKGIVSGHVPGNNIWMRQFDFKNTLKNNVRVFYRKICGFDINKYYQLQKNYVFFQKFLPNNTFDTRVTIIGGKAFGFIRHNRKGDFRASGSGNLDFSSDLVNKDCIKTAFQISQKLGFSCMSYDFLIDRQGNPSIAEISYTFADWAIYACPGYWDNELKWHEGHFWPEYLQLIDFLKVPDLTCPPFKKHI